MISEGAIRRDDDGPSYYGSTSILLNNRSHGGSYDDAERTTLCQLLSVDPHARVRAIRMACLEAQLRARAAVDSIVAEFAVTEESRGIRITVDVVARVIAEAGHRSVAVTPRARGKR